MSRAFKSVALTPQKVAYPRLPCQGGKPTFWASVFRHGAVGRRSYWVAASASTIP
jgi:hypothetical protein